jgi:uncharacterized protein YegP (UPF0339 family)
MAGTLELIEDTAGKFRFRLIADDGEVVAIGAAYESRCEALQGTDSVCGKAVVAAVHRLHV